jgi:hypothetical protein
VVNAVTGQVPVVRSSATFHLSGNATYRELAHLYRDPFLGSRRMRELFQLAVLRFRSDEDGNVGVGVLP